MTIKDSPMSVGGFTNVTIQRQGTVVSVHLDCGDDYKAIVLYEDMGDRVKRQRITITLGPECKV
jgi:hypothetical protein